ncbi:MAG: hypothetical protein JETCAE01_33780 [Anaerolineaceae bacterium]|nr:MAG: hypothetical protein JETCAE01_33780 [Anaerolineaceae bacterium]
MDNVIAGAEPKMLIFHGCQALEKYRVVAVPFGFKFYVFLFHH